MGAIMNAGDCQERHPGEEGVESSEQFCRGGFERVDRTHAAQDHGCVEQCVDPGETANKVVAGDADEQCKGDNGNRQERVPEQAQQVGAPGGAGVGDGVRRAFGHLE